MVDPTLLPSLLASGFLSSSSSRNLFQIPDYTSPPLAEAISATPEQFRDDTYIDLLRAKAGNGTCVDDDTGCQILFHPPAVGSDGIVTKLGVIFYGGALVDPRSYSVMARDLSEQYGLAITIPVFSQDVAFAGCNGTGDRIFPLAVRAFPTVEKWVLVGHSLGSQGAQIDLWNAMQQDDNAVDQLGLGGLVILGGSIFADDRCGSAFDFSNDTIPMAIVSAELDGIITQGPNDHLAPVNDTLKLVINGGNHGYFGYYDYSLRKPILNQVDGNATITRRVQKDLTIGAIVHVASRMGLPLPEIPETECVPHGGVDSSAAAPSVGTNWFGYGVVAALTWSAFAMVI